MKDNFSKAYLIENMDDPAVLPYLKLAMDKRRAEELFYLKDDPQSIHNLVSNPSYADELKMIREKWINS